MNPYRALADAIVLKAVEDYRAALRGERIYPETPVEKTLVECERFFQSEWFMALTNLKGKMIMEKLQGERNESRVNSANT